MTADRARLLAAAAGLAALTAVLGAAFAAGTPNSARWLLLGLLALAWLVFPVAVRLVWRVPVRRAVPLIVAGGILLQLVALSVPPRSTDDFHRYAWDARVQLSGTDPYRYAPHDAALVPLRDEWLFPARCAERSCTVINHPASPTIYPPVAQAFFVAVDLAAPAGARWKPWQAAAGLLAVLCTLALVGTLRASGRDPRWAALWAWCPLVVVEAGNAAHVDVLGVLLGVLGLRYAAARRPVLAGLLLGAATAVKLYPAMLLAAVLRRRGVLVAGVAAALFALSYLPHVAVVGTKVLGYLPGYLSEEGYDGSGRFPVLRLLLPDAVPAHVVLVLAALVLLAVGTAVVLRTDPDRPWDGAVVLTGATLLVAGPNYPWYALLLVALVALSGRWEWLPAAAAAYLPYFAPPIGVPMETAKALSYGAAALLVGYLAAVRAQSARLRSAQLTAPPP